MFLCILNILVKKTAIINILYYFFKKMIFFYLYILFILKYLFFKQKNVLFLKNITFLLNTKQKFIIIVLHYNNGDFYEQ